ncbi:MAG: ABC transporter ATP-binding protein [Lautropia sp.]
MPEPLLRVDAISVRFGGVGALAEVCLEVRAGSLHGLIGPNGAGKTTLLNTISRLVQPVSGRMWFDGHDLLTLAAHEVAPLGISRTFQNFGLIEQLSVLDNVLAGMHSVCPGTIIDELFRIRRRNASERAARERARTALASLGLADIESRIVSTLPYGTRKSVELARALAVDPKLVLLDEPTAGLDQAEMDVLRGRLLGLRDSMGVTILVISHHLEFLIGAVDEITVLDLGRRIAHGDPSIVQRDPAVVAAYIGVDE